MFDVLKKLSWFFKRHWLRYSIAIIVLIIAGVIEMIPPKLLGTAIDHIQLGTLTTAKLVEMLVMMGVLTVVLYGITYVWLYSLFGGAFLAERSYRSKLMRHFLKMTPTFFERNRTGDLMARATNDLHAVSATVGFGILTLVDSTVFLFTIITVMSVFISWKLTLAAMLPLPIIAIVIKYFGKMIHERFTIAQDAFGIMNDQVLENVQGVRVIRAYVQEEAVEQRFQDLTDEVFRKNLAVTQIDALFDPTIKVLVGISYMIGLGYGAYLVFNNSITLGDLVSFNVYLGILIWPMFALGELINTMQRGNASLDRVIETLTYEEDVQDKKVTQEVIVPESIQFDNVTFRYPSSTVDNLCHISITLKRGQTLGIVGRTGSGKTTLLKQLLREYPLGSGEIKVSNVKLENIAVDVVHSWIGYVPQEQVLFSRSVRDNIKMGNPNATEEQVMRVLESASFAQDLQVLSDGLDTLVGEKGVALSGGQKQRISIARALLLHPEILILDDAMSAVDAKTEASIIAHIREERVGKTTLISTHRLSAVHHADWIVVLDEGYISEQGTHEQLMALGGWYKEQYENQQLEAHLTEGG